MTAPHWITQFAKLVGTTLWIASIAWLAHHFADGNAVVAGVKR